MDAHNQAGFVVVSSCYLPFTPKQLNARLRALDVGAAHFLRGDDGPSITVTRPPHLQTGKRSGLDEVKKPTARPAGIDPPA